ncbi:MAG: hypothetical protein ACFFB8_05995 [Promethearchaeota archaeon]
MPVGPTAGPMGGPPDALPPVTRAFTIIFPFLLIYFHRNSSIFRSKRIFKRIRTQHRIFRLISISIIY